MPPTESEILTQTLLPPSNLKTILPLNIFTSLFPPSQRKHPQIPLLYRALQLQRGLDLDAVRENIAAEAERGARQMREIARTRLRDARNSGLDADASIAERGINSADGSSMPGMRGYVDRAHSLESVIPAMEDAERDLIEEVQALDDEVTRMLVEIEGITGALSDLRYGRLPQEPGGGNIGDGLLEGLDELQKLLDNRSENQKET
jgi:centromere-localized protein 2